MEDSSSLPRKRSSIGLYRAIIGAMLTHFCVGGFFLYGNINKYIAAHFSKKHQKHLSPDTTLIIQPLWLLFQTLITILGIPLASKFGFKPVVCSSIFLYSLLNFACAYITNFYLFMLVYGIGSGCCIGLGYLLTLYIGWTYLPKQKSVITGLCLLATGICPSILAPLT